MSLQRDDDSRLEMSLYMCVRAQRIFRVECQNIITLLDKTTHTFDNVILCLLSLRAVYLVH